MQTWQKDRLLRINIVGSSGSGKTTFARELSQKLHSPLIEMDRLFWRPNWTMPSDQEFFKQVESATLSERWILDGNYGRTQDLKWKNATAIIWLNYSLSRTLFQLCRRALHRSWTGEELWPGTNNRENLRRAFFSRKDSIILWMIQNYSKLQERYHLISKNPKYSHILFIELKSPREARVFLDSLESGKT